MEVFRGEGQGNGIFWSQPKKWVNARDGELPVINADLNELLGPE